MSESLCSTVWCYVHGVLIILVLTHSLCAGLCTRISLAAFPALISIRCISEDLKCAMPRFYILKIIWYEMPGIKQGTKSS